MVPLVVVSPVIGYQLVEAVVFFVFIGVVACIAHLSGLGPPLPFAIKTAYAGVVAVYHAALLRAVHRLGIFLLRVERGTEPYVREYRTLLQQGVLVFRHQVVLHLYAGRDAPSVLGYQPEHVTETLLHQVLILVPAITGSYHALAHYVVGVIGFYPLLRILQFACQVYVVHRYLAQRVLAAVAVHVGHRLVHEAAPAQLALVPDYPVFGLVKYVADGGIAQGLRLAVLVGKVVGVEQLARLHVPYFGLAAHERLV